MKVNVKTRDVIEFASVIPKLTEKKPPVKLAYALQKSLRVLRDAAEDAETVRQDLVMKYGTKDHDGMMRVDMSDPEKYKGFHEEWKKVLDEQVEVEIHPVKLSVMQTVDLSFGEVMALYFMIEDDTGA